MSFSLSSWSKAPLALAAALALALPLTSPAQTAANTQRSVAIAIAAQPLGEALNQLAASTSTPIAYSPALVAGKTAPAVQGELTVLQALAQMLAGSGLEYRQESGSIVIRAGSNTQSNRTDALPEVVVTAQNWNGATENTGSYAQSGPSNTATPLGLTLKETPQSVSVVTRQQVDDQALHSVQEILHNAPGISVTQLDSERFSFSSRGFSIDHLQYDGVPTQYTTQYGAGESEVDTALYDRVEIVRGATGLMTGAGDPSAAINLVRKRANSQAFAGNLEASASSWDNYRASADLSTPITRDGRIRSRVVLAQEDKKSFIDNYSRKRSLVYGTVAVDLAPTTQLDVGVSKQRGRATGVTYGGFPLVYNNGAAIDWRSYGRSFSIWPKWSTENSDSTNAFAELSHDWGNSWKTTALAMYNQQSVENTRLFPWGYPDPETGLMSSNPSRVQFPGERTQRSIDIRSTGAFEALGRTHEAAFGLNYSKQKQDFDRIGAADAVPAISLFDWANYPEPSAWGSVVKSELYERTQTGAYGALRLSLAEPLKLIVGGRFNRWDRNGSGYAGRNAYDFRQSQFTPYAGLVYDVGQNYALYGSYTRIYNPQNYRDRDGNFLDPIEGSNWEAGIKGEFFNNRIQASAAVFRLKQNNVAAADIGYVVPGTTSQAYMGADGVVSKGIEFELNGELQPGWNLTFSASHFKATDANRKDFNTAAPRTAVRIFTTYQLPGEFNRLTVGAGANWQSKTTNPTGVYHADNPNGVGEYQQSAYTLASLMARYQVTPQLSLQFNVDNLFDKWYTTSVNFNEQVMWGAPRSYRASLRYQF